MAILSLVFAFLFWPLAIAFGHVARKQIARTGEGGRGLATAGLILGYIGVGFVVLLIIFMASTAAAVSQGYAPAVPFPAAPTSSAMNDVKVTECNSGSGPLGMSGTTVAVTNGTDRTQTYLITVSLNNADGNRLGEAIGAVNSVAPGQTATSDLFDGGADTEGLTACAVAAVDRIPS
jgi:Na+-transporting methylmalonyl-CoA/oxaloacetate decarboxylase gamma subunit